MFDSVSNAFMYVGFFSFSRFHFKSWESIHRHKGVTVVTAGEGLGWVCGEGERDKIPSHNINWSRGWNSAWRIEPVIL